MADAIKIAILGASGYTGAELVRLLLHHPQARIVALSADRHAGKPFGAVFPHLGMHDLPTLQKIEDIDFGEVDLVFCGLPHGTTQEVISALPADRIVIDLSADFRLADPALYETWYGHPHRAVELQREAVYGLTELYRGFIRTARLIANPGCYPTSAILPLAPLLKAGAIDADRIVIDAKSGVSGAGRALKETSLFCEAGEGLMAYGVGRHRHMPEIEQELGAAAGQPVTVSFTPHLIPISRGMLSTIYVTCRDGQSAESLHATLEEAYADAPFVRVLGPGQQPHTTHVRGTNLAAIGVAADRRPRAVVLTCALDNLTKGASGQAVQNMNVRFGFDETEGLRLEGLFP